ncbi:MAG: ATP-binding cassette domain-containing protein [Leptolyngbya sp. SIO4C1]|nr:ATP-binding cassette domain-containing protein [Leptolyngbya sp. SIO4C1]
MNSDVSIQPLSADTAVEQRLSKLLGPAVSTEIVEQLTSAARLQTYSLGQEIYHHSCDRADSSAQQLTSSSSLWLLYQGRVRLLCQALEASAALTVQLLSEGKSFGAASLLAQPLAYRAIAASEVQLLEIPAAALRPLLKQHPELQQRWLEEAEQRDRLIFYRRLPLFQTYNSQQLQQWTAYLQTVKIPAGASLDAAAPGELGRFWLRQGQIQTQRPDGQTPDLGESWGYPQATPRAWSAKTELLVYQLPRAAWEASTELLPALAEASADDSLDQAAQSNLLKLEDYASSGAAPLARQNGKMVTQTAQSPPSPGVVFPKPINRQVLDWLSRYPWIEQQSSSDCGAACLAMITRYWGKRFPIHFLRERANVGRSGASLKSLAKAAESLGLQARPVRASLGKMAEQRNPWIAHWEGTHFVVVYQIRRHQVVIADPAIGRKTYSWQAFKSAWTGYALLLDPTERLRNVEAKQASLGRYIGVLKTYKGLMLQIIAVSLLIQIFGLISPLFTQIILDRVVVQKSMTTLNVVAIGLVLFGIWGICLSSMRRYLLSYFSNRLDLTLISGFISHTVILPLKFFESRRVGDIITRVQENQKIQRFLIGQIVLAWLNFLTGFVYLGLMLYYNWQLTLLVLGLIPPIVLLTLGSTPFLRRLSRELFKEAADQNSALVEMMNGIATVKSTAAEREVRWLWEDRLTRQMNVRFKAQKFGIGLGAANGLINSIGGAVLLWFGASLVIRDQLTIGQLVAFNMMMGRVISPVIALANLWDELQEVLISVERLNDVFETAPEESTQQAQLMLPPIQGEVIFENVTFRYSEEEDRNTLQNLSFRAERGQTIAIVGRSGSGKTTLVKLLEGLYHPNQGRILIDGHDIQHVSPQSLRSQLGVVPQECFLFSGTILENITLYRPEFTLEEVVEAAKLAEAHAFIQALPLGYSTKVGERGSTLSGGQRQRIAIARALLGQPRLLILDEATSSLDTESEHRFQQNLAHISRDRTAFIIAHRLSTVRNADQILVLDQGVLTEQGTHASLIEAQGLYHYLAQQQLDL